MAAQRRVFSDLTNTEGREASKSEAPHSPLYTTDRDFHILEDTPYQSKGDKLTDVCVIEAELVPQLPNFETPQKVAATQAPQVFQPEVPALPGDRNAGRTEDDESGCGLSKGVSNGAAQLVARSAASHRDFWEASVRNGGNRIMSVLQKFGNNFPPRYASIFYYPPSGSPPPPFVDAWRQQRRATQQRCPSAPSTQRQEFLITREQCRAAGSLSKCVKEELSKRTIPEKVFEASGTLRDSDGKDVDARFEKDDGIIYPIKVECSYPEPLPTIERTLLTWNLSHGDIEQRTHATLRGLVNNILRSSHLESERRLPNAESIHKNLSAEERETTLIWLFQVCSTVNLQDTVLHTAVLLLDRYIAALPAKMSSDRLQLVTVAILSISLKMNGSIDENSKPPRLQHLLVHLTQHRYTIQQIFRAEHDVLLKLDFAVSMPTAADLLEAFLMPHCARSESFSPVRCIAQFLLQLSLLDASLHYQYPHAVLAAGAVYVALWCTQQAPEHMQALLEDVALSFDGKVQAS